MINGLAYVYISMAFDSLVDLWSSLADANILFADNWVHLLQLFSMHVFSFNCNIFLQLEQGQLAVAGASDSSDRSKDKRLDQKVIHLLFFPWCFHLYVKIISEFVWIFCMYRHFAGLLKIVKLPEKVG